MSSSLSNAEWRFSRAIWVLSAVIVVLLFIQSGSAPIYILDEAKNAQCAREMVHSGNWVIPTFNGELRTDKPPLHYWFMAISYTLFGVGEVQARLFSAFLGLATVLLVLFQVRRWASDTIAFLSALLLVLSPHFLFEFRLSVPDPYLIFFTTAGLLFGFGFICKRQTKDILIASTALGLAVLSKGPVALFLPGICFFIYIWYQKAFKLLMDWRIWFGIVLILVIAAPWYLVVHVQTNGEFTRGFFIDHNLNRFSDTKEGHGGPFFITPVMVLIGMLPGSLILFPAISKFKNLKQSSLFVFSLMAIGVYVLFFSISSTKLPNYPMPCYPFIAIVCAFGLNEITRLKIGFPKWIWWIWVIFGTSIPIVAFYAIQAEKEVSGFFWLSFLFIPFSLLSIIGFIISRKNIQKGLMVISFSWLLFSATILWVAYPVLYKKNPVSEMLPRLAPDPILVSYKAFNPAFLFNTKKDGFRMRVFENTLSLGQFLDSSKVSNPLNKVYIVSRLDYEKDLDIPGVEEFMRQKDIFELPTTIIYQTK